MLEKIGLPAKPSQRGSNWVVDASHCQGCSSQFTFINRKHHCRRCGGLFCNSCTQHRMVLRGQGDSPVRICEPCKMLEEAARFEMRYGHKNRAGRGHSKLTSKYEDEILSQILGSDGDSSSGRHFSTDMTSSIQTASSSVSSLSTQEVATLNVGADSLKSPLVGPHHTHVEMGSISPEELRQRAVDEKKMYRILKGEGKSEEALKAFKRGKELERQADALEVSIKKNRRKTLISRNMDDIQNKDGPQESGRKGTILGQVGQEKNDLISELRELGWSDADLHDQDKKSANMSLEGELSSLLGGISESTKKDMGSSGIGKTQIVAHKRKALSLKREGKLAEAKEELKKAKILEKQLEEQEFLGADEDSDDEIAALIQSMDSDKHEELLARYERDFDFGQVVVPTDELGFDDDLEVTDGDLVDPEIADTLKSLGWTDDSDTLDDIVTQPVPVDREALLNEILALKRDAVNQKRAGHMEEAMAQLKKAKLLERDLEGLDSGADNLVTPNSVVTNKDSTSQMIKSKDNVALKQAPRSRLMIQKELLASKKKALALRREGKMDEAEEELKRGKVLEQQLEEMDTPSKVTSRHMDGKDTTLTYEHPDIPENIHSGEEREEDVTDKDMHDPTYLSLLSDLGWKDEGDQLADHSSKPAKNNGIHSMQTTEPSVSKGTSNIPQKIPRRSKAEIQRELLGLKRNALTLRREGKTDEAEELLRMAKPLEAQIAEMDAPKTEIQFASHNIEDEIISPVEIARGEGDMEDVTDKGMQDPALLSMLKNLGLNDEELQHLPTQGQQHKQVCVTSAPNDLSGIPPTSNVPALRPRSKREIQKELLDLKRKALALRRNGDTEEAEELLKMGKALEAQMEELDNTLTALPLRSSDSLITTPSPLNGDSHVLSAELRLSDEMGSLGTTASSQGTVSIPSRQQSVNAMDLQPGDSQNSSLMPDETLDNPLNTGFDVHMASLAHPPENFRNNVGKANFGSDVSHQTKPQVHGATLTSPLTYLSNEENLATKKREEPVVSDKEPHSYEANSAQGLALENNQGSLRQEVLARKRKAVALKREGKLAEAREELRQAKLLEKSLEVSIAEPEARRNDVSMPLSNAPASRQKEASASNSPPKPLSGRDRFKLQQESLSHKRQALKLRREGRMEEADAEFELAKALEAQLEQLTSQDSTSLSVHETEPVDVVVEDFLDPQLLSALKAIGIGDTTDTVLQRPERPGPVKADPVNVENISQDRIQLEEQIKSEKVKAVNLKRSGKQAEALDALRRAKMLEKKLNSLAPR